MITWPIDGIDRSIVPMIRRSSGKAETSRVTRMRRASRATIAKAPAWGSIEATTTTKSNRVPAVAEEGPQTWPESQEADRDLGDENGLHCQLDSVEDRRVTRHERLGGPPSR